MPARGLGVRVLGGPGGTGARTGRLGLSRVLLLPGGQTSSSLSCTQRWADSNPPALVALPGSANPPWSCQGAGAASAARVGVVGSRRQPRGWGWVPPGGGRRGSAGGALLGLVGSCGWSGRVAGGWGLVVPPCPLGAGGVGQGCQQGCPVLLLGGRVAVTLVLRCPGRLPWGRSRTARPAPRRGAPRGERSRTRHWAQGLGSGVGVVGVGLVLVSAPGWGSAGRLPTQVQWQAACQAKQGCLRGVPSQKRASPGVPSQSVPGLWRRRGQPGGPRRGQHPLSGGLGAPSVLGLGGVLEGACRLGPLGCPSRVASRAS